MTLWHWIHSQPRGTKPCACASCGGTVVFIILLLIAGSIPLVHCCRTKQAGVVTQVSLASEYNLAIIGDVDGKNFLSANVSEERRDGDYAHASSIYLTTKISYKRTRFTNYSLQ